MSELPESSAFKWTAAKRKAAFALADGATQVEAAKEAEVTDRTIRLWLDEAPFAEEVDRLTLMTGLATRAARLRLAKRVAEKLGDRTEKDLLDWLKFAQSETDGVKLDLAKLAAALGDDEAPVAGGGSN